MLALEDIMDFHKLKQQGMSVRAIAHHTGYNRRTVTKYLRNGLKEPRYKPRAPRPGKLDPYRDYIANRLESFPQLSGQRLLNEIRDRGYRGGYSILASHLRKVRPKPPVEFEQRFETPPGEQAQVDFAEFRVTFTNEPDRQYRVHLFLFVMGCSRWFWGRFGRDQKLPAVLSGHNGAFKALGGAPKTILYDRMKTAVIGTRNGRTDYNRHLLGLLDHYGVTPWACRPYSPKTKGKVERLVSYVRGSFFMAREFADMDDLNRRFEHWCREEADRRRHGTTRRIVADDLRRERPHLRPLPPRIYDEAMRVERKVNREGMVSVDTNGYSVPDNTRSRTVDVHVGPSTLRIFDRTGKLIATHPRLEGRHECRIDPLHRRSPPPGQLNRLTIIRTGRDRVDSPGIPVRPLDIYAAIGDALSQIGGAR